MRVATIYHR